MINFPLLTFSGSGLKCYNCISKNSEACEDPLRHKDDIQPQECNIDQINQLADKARDIAHSLGTAFGVDVPQSKKENHVPIVCQKLVSKGINLLYNLAVTRQMLLVQSNGAQ